MTNSKTLRRKTRKTKMQVPPLAPPTGGIIRRGAAPEWEPHVYPRNTRRRLPDMRQTKQQPANEVSGDTPLISNRTSGTRGSAKSSYCPDGGMACLTDNRDPNRFVMVNTTCKAWRCLGCRERLLRVFRMRVEVGVSTLGRCAFTTLTFRLAYGSVPRDAPSAAKAWRELWRRLRKLGEPWNQMKWLRVVELTKRRQPHYHVVMGSIPNDLRIRCYGSKFDHRTFVRTWDRCQCLSHIMSRVWYSVTGDSYIVHSIPVTGARGAGRYLAKYMLKDMIVREELEKRGFKRRWSNSRGWPGAGRMRFRKTVEKSWGRIFWMGKKVGDWYEEQGYPGKWPDLEERVGPDLVKLVMERDTKRGALAKLKGMEKHVPNVG